MRTHCVYDTDGTELGYAREFKDAYGVLWDVVVTDLAGGAVQLGAVETKEEVDEAVKEWVVYAS